MPAIAIDRLTIQVPGLSEGSARRLALAVADGLAAAGPVGCGGEVGSLQVDLIDGATGSPDRLADQIVAEILRQLRRES